MLLVGSRGPWDGDRLFIAFAGAMVLGLLCEPSCFAQDSDESLQQDGWSGVISTISLSYNADESPRDRVDIHHWGIALGMYWEIPGGYFAIMRWPVSIKVDRLAGLKSGRGVVSGDPSIGGGVVISLGEADLRLRGEYTLPIGQWYEDDNEGFLGGSGFHELTLVVSLVQVLDPVLIDFWSASSFGVRVEMAGTRINPGIFSLGVAVTEVLNDYVALSVSGAGTVALASVIEGSSEGYDPVLSQQAAVSMIFAVGERVDLEIGVEMANAHGVSSWTSTMAMSYRW